MQSLKVETMARGGRSLPISSASTIYKDFLGTMADDEIDMY